MTTAMSGGVFDVGSNDEFSDLRQLVTDLGRRSAEAQPAHRTLPDRLDTALWADLEQTGLARLTSTLDLGGPAEAAIVLSGLARHAAAVPIAETDVLAAWLGATAGLELPASGPLTIAVAEAGVVDDRVTGTAQAVSWARSAAAVVLAVHTPGGLGVAIIDGTQAGDGHNLAGEPRGSVEFDLGADDLVLLDDTVGDELMLRGAWARCVQIIGALDAAAELTVDHTRERKQFGRSLSAFQSVQHSLANMAGEIERARAAVGLSVVAANDHGFDSPETAYAVTVAKATVGQVVPVATGIAHQLHGAIGVTIEHRLWLMTMRAQSWADEFGSTNHHARRLGRAVLAADDPWDVLMGNDLRGWE